MSRYIVVGAFLLAILALLNVVDGAAESVTGQSEGRAGTEPCATNDDCDGSNVCSLALGMCLENVKSDVTDGVQSRGGVEDDINDGVEVDVDDEKVTLSGGWRVGVVHGAVVFGAVAMLL